MSLGRKTANAVGNAVTGATGVANGLVTDVKDIAVDTVKLADCNVKLAQATSTMRFASAEAGDLFKKSFLADCMASK
jgi:hypothetical protein